MAASNAVVAVVGMYAGLLADAEGEAERNGRALAELAEQIGRDAAEHASELQLMRANADHWEAQCRRLEEVVRELREHLQLEVSQRVE